MSPEPPSEPSAPLLWEYREEEFLDGTYIGDRGEIMRRDSLTDSLNALGMQGWEVLRLDLLWSGAPWSPYGKYYKVWLKRPRHAAGHDDH